MQPPRGLDFYFLLQQSPVQASDQKDKIRIHHITKENFTNYSFARFKEEISGVIEFSAKLSESAVGGRSIKTLYLKKEFQNQGLGIEHIRG